MNLSNLGAFRISTELKLKGGRSGSDPVHARCTTWPREGSPVKRPAERERPAHACRANAVFLFPPLTRDRREICLHALMQDSICGSLQYRLQNFGSLFDLRKAA
jgi:hypothetical protein